MFERLTTKNIGDRGEALAARELKKHGLPRCGQAATVRDA